MDLRKRALLKSSNENAQSDDASSSSSASASSSSSSSSSASASNGGITSRSSLPPPFPSSSIGSGVSTVMMPPPPPQSASHVALTAPILPPRHHHHDSSTSAIAVPDWRNFFDQCDDVTMPNSTDTVRVYRTYRTHSTSSTPPHFSPQTRSFAPPLRTHNTILVLVHGGGHSAMSWALCTQHLREWYDVCAMDLRGHGATITADETNLSTSVLVNDLVDLLNLLFVNHDDLTFKFVLVGHSLGGAIVVRAANDPRLAPRMSGLVVLDVVEGSALASLPSMSAYLNNRPTRFPSFDKAVKWGITSGGIRNVESAIISIPSQLVKQPDGFLVWRTDLRATEPYWKDWFTGLSDAFLSAKCSKMLLLAGTDRLDNALIVAQMQGKFQLGLIHSVGHVIQEDAPEKTAKQIVDFVTRFQL